MCTSATPLLSGEWYSHLLLHDIMKSVYLLSTPQEAQKQPFQQMAMVSLYPLFISLSFSRSLLLSLLTLPLSISPFLIKLALSFVVS